MSNGDHPAHPQALKDLTLQIECESDSDSDLSSVNDQEVTTMLHTLKKYKKILKQGKLSQYKQKHRKTNQAFHQMSNFFHIQKKYFLRIIKGTKDQRIKGRQDRLNTQINQKTMELSHKKKKQNRPSQPQIIEQNEYAMTSEPVKAVQFRCQICRKLYSEVHHFYGYFCPPCAQLNMQKRTQKADLTGLTALVTGGRIKIGYQIAIKLLRDGANVFVTSRFTNDTVLRYKAQKDYEQWRHRLHIIQCDFLSQAQVNFLITYIKENVPKLDILINNAAQTIVRPKQFYTKELQNEKLMIQDKQKDLPLEIIKHQQVVQYPSVFASQVTVQPGEIDLEQLDEFGQPTDKREVNTWRQNIENVSLLDCYTTQVINSIVPFHLISQLKPLMKGPTPSWIINVSAMQGVFNRAYKSQNHPHTNMAKAALNMITRTSALSFASQNIYMNSVDTGWVTNENPYNLSQRMTINHGFKCPLDCIDGAMRVLDPIYLGVSKQEFPFGWFLKDYKQSAF